MPKRHYPHPLIYEQLVGERLFDPFAGREENPVSTTAPIVRDQGWCEDRPDPASWEDPDIIDEPEDPHAVAH